MLRTLPQTRSCFVCGVTNPLGLGLRFQTDGERVFAWFEPRPEHAGFMSVVHGGLVSTILDETMVWAVGVRCHRFVYCGELRVRFLAPARPGSRLRLAGWLVQNRKERLFEAKAELRDAEERLLAWSTGKYLPLSAEEQEHMLQDFVGDTTALFNS